jgi:VWFA-related protein
MGRALVFARLIAALSMILSWPLASQTSPPSSASEQDQTTFKLRIESNLVVVRAVVRDAQGHPVENLRQEDFRLFDNGKEQTITQFSVEVRKSASSSASEKPDQRTQPSSPERFLAFYFDDLDMPFDDIVRARDAADRYLATKLGPSDRAAVFTSSGTVEVDFTSDLKALHEALLKLRARSRLGGECPNITDYQAKMIVEWAPHFGLEGSAPASGITSASAGRGGLTLPAPAQTAPANPGTDAMAVALDEAANVCHALGVTNAAIVLRAQRVLGQAVLQAQYSLQGLKDVINHVSDMPGQRNVILISSGFLASELGTEVNAVVDRALRSQIVVSSIDSKGLAVSLTEIDIRVGYTTVDPHLSAVKRDLAFNREQATLSVLAQVAEETGGEFFHNDNDFDAGLRKVTTPSEISYVLAFVPRNLKSDGHFHALKVTLSDKRKGTTLQARRGYFAPRTGARPADELAEKVRAAVLSTDEIQQLPLDISTEVSRVAEKNAGKAELAVMARLEVGPVRFRKDGDRNRNTLTFVSTIFDRDGLWIGGQQKQVQLDLSDAKLHELLASPGVLVRSTFQITPGTYSIREVVMDSEDHHLSALSRTIEVPEFQRKSSKSSSAAESRKQ